MKKPLLFMWMILLAAGTVLAACGGGPPTTSVERTVEMNEFSFIPDTITVPAGSTVTLNLKNSGALEHEYVIMVLGRNTTLPFDEDDEPNVYWEKELLGGEEEAVEFTAPSEPGEYQVVCGTLGHLEQGMQGTLIVTE